MKDIIFEENIENEETDLQVDKEKFGQAVIWGTDWTTETIARQLEKAIEFSYDIMETNSPFSRYNKGISNNRFNRCIFELFSFYFSNKDIREMVLRNKKEFVEAFITLNDDNEFISAISDSAKETKRVCTRFSKFVNLLNDIRIKLTCKTELKLLTIKGDGIGVEIIS